MIVNIARYTEASRVFSSMLSLYLRVSIKKERDYMSVKCELSTIKYMFQPDLIRKIMTCIVAVMMISFLIW